VGIGAFAGVVGAHDAFSSIEVGSRFGGMLLFLAGLALIAVAIFLFAGLSWSLTAGVLISPVAALIGLSFISAQLRSVDQDWAPIYVAICIAALALFLGIYRHWTPLKLILLSAALLTVSYLAFLAGDHDERLVFWVAIVFAAILASFTLWTAETPNVAISAVKVLGGMAGFFTLSALIGGAQLWYTSQYLPASLGASLSMDSRLTWLGRQGGEEVAELTLSIQNTGQTQAKILDSLYRVVAAPLNSIRLTDRGIRERLADPAVNDRTVARFRGSFSWDLVQAGRIFADGSWLDPEERYSVSSLVYLPRGRYDTLRSKAVVLIAKDKALTLDGGRELEFAHRPPSSRVRGFASQWPIEETSWFRQLTRSNRELQIDWVSGRPRNSEAARFPHLSYAVFRVGSNAAGDELSSYNEQLFTEYGLGETRSNTEMMLGPSASP
jgi:hypothetical protein